MRSIVVRDFRQIPVCDEIGVGLCAEEQSWLWCVNDIGGQQGEFEALLRGNVCSYRVKVDSQRRIVVKNGVRVTFPHHRVTHRSQPVKIPVVDY